jgi:hypothetical protein
MLFVWSCVLCLLDMHSKHLLRSSMIRLIDHNFPVWNKMFCHVVQFGNEIMVVEFFLYGLITKVFGLLTFKYRWKLKTIVSNDSTVHHLAIFFG